MRCFLCSPFKMMITVAIVIGLLTVFLTAGQNKEPENVIATASGSVTLKCSSGLPSCLDIKWLKSQGSTNIPIYQIDTGISESYRERYSVDDSSGCDLVIMSVVMTDAGLFHCKRDNTILSSTNLNVQDAEYDFEEYKKKSRRKRTIKISSGVVGSFVVVVGVVLSIIFGYNCNCQ